MYTFHKLPGIALLLSSTLFVLTACTKTNRVEEKMPYSDIEAFVVMGYAGDSINAVIKNNDIIIYWSGEATVPATVKPNIVVSPHATITPASGTEVAFSSATTYTVTAEDGTTKTYRLQPVLNKPIPRIYTITPNNLHWITTPIVAVTGEYFLSGDTSDVKVYAQRISDGYEFDLVIDYSKISMTGITASLPAYNNLMDTGVHKIWVKIGDRVSDEKLVNLRMPDIYPEGVLHFSFPQAGQPVVAGDSVTIRIWDDHNGQITKWYKDQYTRIAIENYAFEKPAFSQTDSTLTFKVPDFPMDVNPWSLRLSVMGPYYSITDISRILPTSAWPLFPIKK